MKRRFANGAFLVVILLVTLAFHANGLVWNWAFSEASPISCEAPKVILQEGSAGLSTIYTNSTSAEVGISASQTLYVHEELTVIGRLVCRLLKLDVADSVGQTCSAEANTTGRKLLGCWVYQLAGVQSIPTSTWNVYYRVDKTNSAIEAHCDVDVKIRMSNGTVRQTMATDVANSEALTTSWSTLSGTYSWVGYNVVDETDYLEIDFFIEVTSEKSSEHVNMRVDDNTLAEVNQTRTMNIYLPNTYDYVLRVNNTVTDSWQVRLKEYSSSSIGRLQNCTIYFHNSTDGASSQIIIENGSFINETGPWYNLGTYETVYLAMAVQANSAGTSYVFVYLEVLTPSTTTYAQCTIAVEIN